MKKIIAKTTLLLIIVSFLGLLVYVLYVKPMMQVKSADGFLEYLLVFIILTVMYGILVLLIKGIIKLIDWCASNVI